jgi:sulfate permease, SulP family
VRIPWRAWCLACKVSPMGLASRLLAGVNPLAGLYAYMVGTITGAFFTSSAFMAV